MLYGLLSILLGIGIIFIAVKLSKRDNNEWDKFSSFRGYVAGLLLIALGVSMILRS